MRTVSFICYFFLTGFVCSTQAATIGGNLDAVAYPEFAEALPQAPAERNPEADLRYRQAVEKYAEAAARYIERCNADLQKISEQRQAAAQYAKRVVTEFNEWAKRPMP